MWCLGSDKCQAGLCFYQRSQQMDNDTETRGISRPSQHFEVCVMLLKPSQNNFLRRGGGTFSVACSNVSENCPEHYSAHRTASFVKRSPDLNRSAFFDPSNTFVLVYVDIIHWTAAFCWRKRLACYSFQMWFKSS